jgi:hypothetical protein
MDFNGTRSAKLGENKLTGYTCEKCQKEGNVHMSILAKYFHILWIPTLSLGKEASTKCFSCGNENEHESLSPELKERFKIIKVGYKAPWYHWSFSVILIVLIGISFIFSATGNSEEDPRMAMIEKDEKVLDTKNIQTGDSLAAALKAYVEGKLEKAIDTKSLSVFDPKEFSYYSKTNGKKILLLVKVSNYGNLKEDKQEEIISTVKEFIKKEKSLQDKEIYLGIKSMFDLKMAATPKGEETGAYMSEILLCDFYDVAPNSKK